ncbi:MAG TPA: class I SAM-dependent methyltransferase [Vicinamibacterales bacterium]|nr:class I SAM-dependent methyltransferase [Vicinamibacterales bacterium]
MAPRTGDVLHELTLEAAECLGLSFDEAADRVARSGEEFRAEWERLVRDPRDADAVVRFYSESAFELFEQIAWHATEPIHHRSLVCADLAATRPGRELLDYGSGIGSNAIVFGLAGFRVTLADVADPLLRFARWRCERRGLAVRTIDLKREPPERGRYDVVTCFDVLEHVPDPIEAVRRMRDALRPGGVLFLYAPFGPDPERPQHIVHEDPVTPRIRSLGFDRLAEWEERFPFHVRAPACYVRVTRSAAAGAAYYVRDRWLNGPVGDAVARLWRRLAGGARRTAATGATERSGPPPPKAGAAAEARGARGNR